MLRFDLKLDRLPRRHPVSALSETPRCSVPVRARLESYNPVNEMHRRGEYWTRSLILEACDHITAMEI